MNKKLEKEILDLANSIKEDKKEIKGEKESNSIQDIRYIYKALKLDGKDENIICVVLDKGDGNTSQRYYISGERVCVWDEDISTGPIFTQNREKTQEIDLEKLRLLIQNPKDFGKEEISLSEELAQNDKLVEKIANELGVSKDDIRAMGLLKSKQKVEEKEKKEKAEKEKKQEAQEDIVQENNVYADDLNIKQNVKVNTKVNEIQTLAQFLKLPSECERIAVIETDEMSKVNGEEKSGTRYSFVAINKKGEVKKIEGLEQDMSVGNTAMQETYKVMHDGDVERSQVTSRYKINGTNAGLSIKKNNGQLEVFVFHKKTEKDNEPVETQVETDNIMPIKTEIREVLGYYKGNRISDKVADVAKKNYTGDYDTTEYKDYDGNKATKSDNFNEIGLDDKFEYEGEMITLRKYAERNKYNNLDELKNMFEKAKGNTAAEKLENVDDLINEQAKGVGFKK